jgi:hypothetical protein
MDATPFLLEATRIAPREDSPDRKTDFLVRTASAVLRRRHAKQVVGLLVKVSTSRKLRNWKLRSMR